MTVHFVKIPLMGDDPTQNKNLASRADPRADASLAHYLGQAETMVNAMAEAELGAAESKLQSQITSLMSSAMKMSLTENLKFRD